MAESRNQEYRSTSSQICKYNEFLQIWKKDADCFFKKVSLGLHPLENSLHYDFTGSKIVAHLKASEL